LIPLISIISGRYLFTSNFFYQVLLGLFIGGVTVLLIYFRDKAISRSLNYIKGHKGEKYVENLLSKLSSSDYKIIRTKRVKYGNIDFLVVCKNGIFCIEEKNIGGKITYDERYQVLLRNGYEFDRDYLRQTKRNAREVNQNIKEKLKLDRFVVPILVFSDPGVIIDTKNGVELVKVLSSSQLLNYLTQPSGSTIDSQTIEAVANLYK